MNSDEVRRRLEHLATAATDAARAPELRAIRRRAVQYRLRRTGAVCLAIVGLLTGVVVIGRPLFDGATAPIGSPTPTTTPSVATVPTPTSQIPPPSSTAGTPAGTARCATSQLSATFTVVPGSAGAGNIIYSLQLRNISARSCTTYGWVGMRLLTASHQALPTSVQRTGTPLKVSLAPGATASATVRLSPDVPGPGEPVTGVCEAASAFVEVTPPDDYAHLIAKVDPPTPVCEHGSLQTMPLSTG